MVRHPTIIAAIIVTLGMLISAAAVCFHLNSIDYHLNELNSTLRLRACSVRVERSIRDGDAHMDAFLKGSNRRIWGSVTYLCRSAASACAVLQVVAERLLDDHPLAVGGELRCSEALDDGREQRGRDLEIEDRVAGLRHGDRLADLCVGARVAKVTWM